jgi:hypothetical protein
MPTLMPIRNSPRIGPAMGVIRGRCGWAMADLNGDRIEPVLDR